jgi:cell wall-associated NlpC family hydrolase
VVAAAAIAMTGSMATAAHAAPSTTELTKQINAASDKLEDVTESYNKLQIDLKKTTDEQKRLAASLAPTKAALAAASSQVDTIAAASYKQGRVGPMTALLTAGDQESLIDRMSYLEQINRANQRDITIYTKTTTTYNQRQAALKTTQAKQSAQLRAIDGNKTKIASDLKKLRAMRVQAYGSADVNAPRGAAGPPPAISGSAGEAVDYAYAAANRAAMYKSGASGPSYYDCSGLTSAAWAAAGKSLPHNAAAQYGATARITRGELKAGDLVFYRGAPSPGHVGIYVGGGMIIDASKPGEPVSKRSINIMTPSGYGRVR